MTEKTEVPRAISNSPACDEAAREAHSKLISALNSRGIDVEYYASKLKAELEANETKVFHGTDGLVYSDDLIAWKVRQEARRDLGVHLKLSEGGSGDDRPILVIQSKAKSIEVKV